VQEAFLNVCSQVATRATPGADKNIFVRYPFSFKEKDGMRMGPPPAGAGVCQGAGLRQIVSAVSFSKAGGSFRLPFLFRPAGAPVADAGKEAGPIQCLCKNLDELSSSVL
jgi:hypothetical protein